MRHRTSIVVLMASVWLVAGSAQQPPLPRTPGDAQPGRKWSEEQLRQAAGAVRAGRTLTPRRWPNGARIAVALTFTLNNSANMFARGDSAVVQLTGGEFGAVTGLPRVLDVLDRQKVPATFFIAATAAIVDPQMIAEIVKRTNHEIGVMGWSDENPLAIDDAIEEERLLTRATDFLTKAAGRKPVGARGPSSALSLHTMGLLKKAGFLYDSTLMGMDEPYEVLVNGQPSGIVELPVSRLLDDQPTLTSPRFGPSSLPSPELVFETFRDDFDGAYQEGTLFLLTLHPHLIGMRSRIGYLDDFITYMKSKPGVWFATAAEIARHVTQPPGKNGGQGDPMCAGGCCGPSNTTNEPCASASQRAPAPFVCQPAWLELRRTALRAQRPRRSARQLRRPRRRACGQTSYSLGPGRE